MLKSKVHLTQRLMDEKQLENQKIKEDLCEARENFSKIENDYYNLKQKSSKLRTSSTHSNIEIDFAEKKKRNLAKKLGKEQSSHRINVENLELLKNEYENLKKINEQVNIFFNCQIFSRALSNVFNS